MLPHFFAKASDFRHWLERNSAMTGELIVGFHSAVNVAKAERLIAQGRMQPAGLAAYQRRTAARTSIYSYEQAAEAQLTDEEQRRFRRDKIAWQYFQASPAAYRRTMLHRVAAAKRPETRARRLELLIAACAEGTRL